VLADELTEALEHAADQQPFIPDHRLAIGAAHRRRRHRKQASVSALVVILVLGIGFGAAGWSRGTGGQLSSIHVVEPTAAPDPLLNGPKGPSEITVFGRAYPIGTATTETGQAVNIIAFEGGPVDSATGTPGSALCYATWPPGHALVTAQIFGCTQVPGDSKDAVVFLPVTADGFTYVGSREVKEVNIVKSDLIASLPRSVARAELIVARNSDVPNQPPAQGHTVKTERIPVSLLGAGQSDMPTLIGAVAPVSSNDIVLGFDAWNSKGQRIIHEYTDSYCGPSPADATRYPISIPRRPLAC
jgi:hypothetical protein